jgi:hypothetical protein
MRENTFGGGGLHASLERRIVQKSSRAALRRTAQRQAVKIPVRGSLGAHCAGRLFCQPSAGHEKAPPV